ncbi:uncharacterized protein, partial [Littorina saxatilis]|uniref:uncharacterized protein n=1 Tax=Littorina saxatilis TaxID=31220 RepID=UPI0038B60202
TCVDDFDLFCPYPWTDRTVQTLKCIVPTNKLNSPSPCDTYIDTVEFRIIKGSSDKLACTVTNINTACNNNNILADTCGCQSNDGTDITIVYKINAVRNLHENAQWACRPQCYDASGNIAIQARNTSACFQTRFEDPNNNVGQAPEKEGGIGGAALKRNEGLSSEEKGGIGGGAAVVAIGCGSGVIVFVIKKTKIYVYLFFPPDQLKNYEILQKEIEKMWGVGIGKITPKDKEKYKNADYVIDISKLSGDQKQKLTE